MAGRRLPSSLATHVRACKLFQSGQRCATCPEAGAAACPLRDIEDVPAFVLARARRAGAGTGGAGAAPGSGFVALQSRPGRPVPVAPAPQRCAHSAAAHALADAPADATAAGGEAHVARAAPPGAAAPGEARPRVPAAESEAGPGAHRVALSSKEGRRLFKEALAAGSLQPYFALSEQMVFQPDAQLRPVTCLSVVLNALGHDPHKTWKPIWRWNTEEVLLEGETGARGIAESLERRGLRLDEMAEMARNKGARAQAFPACPSVPLEAVPLFGLLGRPRGQDAFRSRVAAACSAAAHPQEHLVVHRQSPRGDWQFAPVAGYHAGSDRVLLLDLNRAGAPRWVPLASLWGSMCVSAAGHTGGYVVVGSMDVADAMPTAPGAASCPRVVRSWGEGRLTVEPVAEACPMGVWAALGSRGLPRRASKVGRHAMRLGAVSPAAAKRRSRASLNGTKVHAAEDEMLALASLMLQALPRTVAAQGAHAGGGRSVHSSPATPASSAAGAEPAVGAASVEEAR